MERGGPKAIGWRVDFVQWLKYTVDYQFNSQLSILNFQLKSVFIQKKSICYFTNIYYIYPIKLNMTMGDYDNKEREEVFSKKVRAGKRTYFFDVKATRSNDYYVTVTESKKRLEDGVFIKHKIFLYKEDFEKFAEGLKDTIDYIKAHQEVVEKRYEYSENQSEPTKENDDFSFEI